MVHRDTFCRKTWQISLLMKPMASTAAADPLQISPAFAPQYHTSHLNFFPSSHHFHQSPRPTPAAIEVSIDGQVSNASCLSLFLPTPTGAQEPCLQPAQASVAAEVQDINCAPACYWPNTTHWPPWQLTITVGRMHSLG